MVFSEYALLVYPFRIGTLLSQKGIVTHKEWLKLQHNQAEICEGSSQTCIYSSGTLDRSQIDAFLLNKHSHALRLIRVKGAFARTGDVYKL